MSRQRGDAPEGDRVDRAGDGPRGRNPSRNILVGIARTVGGRPSILLAPLWVFRWARFLWLRLAVSQTMSMCRR